MSSIEFKAVNKRYGPEQPWVIHDADLTIARGEFCVFVGPSGCGKSTLLRMVAGLEEITSGELQIDGQRVNELAPAKRGVAMVFQSYALYPHMTVRENMGFGLKVFGSDKAEIAHKVNQAAEILQLTPLLDRLPKQLSGGQRQRVAIGRAIVKEPRVFLFDEPLSNLDAALRVQTRFEIAKLHQDIGSASMIYVTHDQVEAMTLADRIVLLNTGAAIQRYGSVAQFGTPMDLYHRPANLFAAEFIGSPKMNLLPCRLLQAASDSAVVELSGQRLAVAVDARRAAAGADLQLGIRPEHILLADAGQSIGLAARLLRLERLGDASLLYVETAAGLPMMTVRIEGHGAAVGQSLRLCLLPERLHLFDGEGLAFPRTVQLPE